MCFATDKRWTKTSLICKENLDLGLSSICKWNCFGSKLSLRLRNLLKHTPNSSVRLGIRLDRAIVPLNIFVQRLYQRCRCQRSAKFPPNGAVTPRPADTVVPWFAPLPSPSPIDYHLRWSTSLFQSFENFNFDLGVKGRARFLLIPWCTVQRYYTVKYQIQIQCFVRDVAKR